MIADSSKPNKLRNVYAIRSTARNVTIKNGKFTIHLDKSLAYSSFKVEKLNARKIFQKHKTDSQFTDSERKHVVACRSKEQMESQIFKIYVLQYVLF